MVPVEVRTVRGWSQPLIAATIDRLHAVVVVIHWYDLRIYVGGVAKGRTTVYRRRGRLNAQVGRAAKLRIGLDTVSAQGELNEAAVYSKGIIKWCVCVSGFEDSLDQVVAAMKNPRIATAGADDSLAAGAG